MDHHEAIWRQLLKKEIERIVANERAKGGILHTGYHAGQLAATYPAANLSVGRIIDEIVAAAALADLPIEISLPNECSGTDASSPQASSDAVAINHRIAILRAPEAKPKPKP